MHILLNGYEIANSIDNVATYYGRGDVAVSFLLLDFFLLARVHITYISARRVLYSLTKIPRRWSNNDILIIYLQPK